MAPVRSYSTKEIQYIAPQAKGTVLTSNGPTLNPSYQSVQVQAAKVTLTSAQLKALPTAIALLAAAGAGNMIVVLSLTLQYKFGTVAYTIANSDNAFEAVYHGDTHSLATINATGLVDQTANTVASAAGLSPTVAQTVANNKGVDLILAGTGPALTLGDGTVVVTMSYQIVPLA